MLGSDIERRAPSVVLHPLTRPSREELLAAVGAKVPDVIADGLDVLFCGINPGLYSGAVGHHFARPGNRFWKVLHLAGLTERQLRPDEEAALLAARLGVTNIVSRATATAGELGRDELAAGWEIVVDKVRRYEPMALAVLGMQAYRGVVERHARLGRQDARLGTTSVFVLPNPSGLQARYQLGELVELFGLLRPSDRPDGAG